MNSEKQNFPLEETEGGLSLLRLAFASTLALGLIWLMGWGLAVLTIKAAYSIELPWLAPYLPSLSIGSLSFGVAFFALLVGYLHFGGRMKLLTRCSQRLPSFLHLSGDWCDYPANLGFNYTAFVSARFFAVAVFVSALAALGLDYLSSIHHGHFGDSASATLASLRGDRINFLLAAITGVVFSGFALEMVFRGYVQNLWYSAFKAIGRTLSRRTDYMRYLAHVFSYGAGVAAVTIAAALFALVYDEDFLTGFYLGAAAGAAYVLTRSIWAPVFVHLLVKTVWLVALALTIHIDEGASEQALQAQPTGLKVPGVSTVFQPGMQAKPIRKVVENDFSKPDFAAGGNVLIQVCRSQQCAEQMSLLEALSSQFPDVEFMQADEASNKMLVERLAREQEAMTKGSKLALPVYLYVNGNIQVAPTGTADLSDLKKFVELNRTGGGPQMAGRDRDEGQYVSRLCNPENQGAFDGKVLYNCAYDLVLNTDLALLDKAKRDAFVRSWKEPALPVSTEAETAKAIAAMLSSLDEMHTQFFTAAQFASLSQSFDASLTGIGAPVIRLNVAGKLATLGDNPPASLLQSLSKIDDATPLVIYPAPTSGSPAEKAGLQRGDRIVEVDGQSVNGMTVDQVVAAIRGKEGTSVALKVHREGTASDLSFSITRAKVQTKEVHLEELSDGKFKVKVDMFGNRVSQEFTEALYQACTGSALPADDAELVKLVNQYVPEKNCTRVKSMVIDLRGNPGGRLDQVVEMMQALIKEGKVVTTLSRAGDDIIEVKESVNEKDFVRETFKGGKSVRLEKQPRMMRVLPEGLPLAVLVDAGSASASELMSGALQQGKFAVVVGKPSFGKEVGQAVNPLDFGTGLRITTFRFLPGGADLGVAVIPDVEVANSSAYLDNPLNHSDEVVAKAFEVLAAAPEKFQGMDPEHKKALESKTRAEHEARDRRILEMQKKSAE